MWHATSGINGRKTIQTRFSPRLGSRNQASSQHHSSSLTSASAALAMSSIDLAILSRKGVTAERRKKKDGPGAK
jgi:hypothetical protein